MYKSIHATLNFMFLVSLVTAWLALYYMLFPIGVIVASIGNRSFAAFKAYLDLVEHYIDLPKSVISECFSD